MQFLIKVLVTNTSHIEAVKAACEGIEGVKEVKVVPDEEFTDHELEVNFEGAEFEAKMVRTYIARKIDHVSTALDPEEIKE